MQFLKYDDNWLSVQLGAFLAGALLAETNFRTQIEADIRPFRGLLLGLFFVTTGTSIDTQVFLFIMSYIFRHLTQLFILFFRLSHAIIM